jgi:glycerophosphoryl diester phosphodiesterase
VPEAGGVKLLSHRGVHQTFRSEDLQNDTCTAERIYPPTHHYIENTLPSMRAAFEHGASVVELDIHLTPDGQFGYGYTADGGKTYPLRGKGIGLMPTLAEVLREPPKGKFPINFKSQKREEAEALADMLKEIRLGGR